MKKLPTSKQIREKYNQEEIDAMIKQSIKRNENRLRRFLNDKDSVLQKYEPPFDEDQIGFISIWFQEAVFYLELNQEQRLKISQQERDYYKELAQTQLKRINIILEDEEIFYYHVGFDLMRRNLQEFKSELEVSIKKNKGMKVSHLFGLRIYLKPVVSLLEELRIRQKDQVRLIKDLFDEYNFDWGELEEDKREDNIRVSFQQPARLTYKTVIGSWLDSDRKALTSMRKTFRG